MTQSILQPPPFVPCTAILSSVLFLYCVIMISSIKLFKNNVENLLLFHQAIFGTYFGIKSLIKTFLWEYSLLESAPKEVVSVSDVNFEQVFDRLSQHYSIFAMPPLNPNLIYEVSIVCKNDIYICHFYTQWILRPEN